MLDKLTPNKIYNLVLSWILISVMFLANSAFGLSDPAFFKSIKWIVFLIAVILLWLMINRISNQKFIKVVMILFSTVYFTAASAINRDYFFAAGLCAVLGVIIICTDISDLTPKVGNKVFYSTVSGLVLLFIVVVGVNSCFLYLNHWAACYDFGIFSQMFHYMRETGIPYTTCERDMLMSHFAVHMSPVFYLILPVYYLFPSPVTLDIIQSIIVVSGVVPLILIMKRHSIGKGAVMLFSAIYVLFPGFAGGCFYHLHENCFLAPLILWFIYYCEKEKWYGQAIFAVLLLAVKEDAAVYVAIIVLYFLFTSKNYKCNLCIFIASILYFIGVTRYLSALGDGVMMYRYNNYLFDGDSPMSIISAVVTNPVYVIGQIATADKIKFILLSLMPLGFLPLMTKDYRRFILMLPWILINLMPNYGYQYDMRYQYCFGTGALLIYMAVINYSDKKPAKMLLYGVCCALIMCVCVNLDHLGYIGSFNRSADRRDQIDYAVSLVPKDSSVAATAFLVADFSDHDILYELERTDKEAEYYVLDLRQSSDKYSIVDYLNNRYEEIYYEPEVIAVFRRAGVG